MSAHNPYFQHPIYLKYNHLIFIFLSYFGFNILSMYEKSGKTIRFITMIIFMMRQGEDYSSSFLKGI